MAEHLKLFILGPARSGTSIMYFAAREVLGLKGKGESHVVPVFDQMVRLYQSHVAKYKDTPALAGALEIEPFRRSIAEFLRKFYGSAYPDGSWVDKTPGRVLGVPLIFKAFPDARVVIARRTGIETVMSHMAKFDRDFDRVCRLWARAMKDIVALRNRPRSLVGRVLEQDQFDLSNDTEASAVRIAGHVGQPGMAGALAAFFRDRRVQKSSRHAWDRRLTLAETPWPDEQKAIFVRECGPMMETFGYPM